MARFNSMISSFSAQVDFLVIYIEEAHPTDGWSLGKDNPKIVAHQKLQERIDAAKHLVELTSPKCNVFVDPMDNPANKAYGGLFERLYVLHEGKIAYMGAEGPSGYNTDEVAEFLKQLLQ
eukprot:m.43065 g.43065  ORF g.43065 m.43065 type:complete len:120 (+) comp17082_c0_seq1:532-891(+)